MRGKRGESENKLLILELKRTSLQVLQETKHNYKYYK